VLAALATAVAVASVAAAEPPATKQRVNITIKFHDRIFVLAPLEAGALERDSGTIVESANAVCRDVIRDGQKIGLCTGNRWTLTGSGEASRYGRSRSGSTLAH